MKLAILVFVFYIITFNVQNGVSRLKERSSMKENLTDLKDLSTTVFLVAHK